MIATVDLGEEHLSVFFEAFRIQVQIVLHLNPTRNQFTYWRLLGGARQSHGAWLIRGYCSGVLPPCAAKQPLYVLALQDHVVAEIIRFPGY
jgi:hypothetical protein